MSAFAEGIARSRDEIASAKVLNKGGFPAQAVSRCYYAAFFAAEAALLSIGESRSRHAGVISAFGILVVQGEGVDEQAGRLLRSLYDRRSHAEYDFGPVPLEEAAQAIEDAETVVSVIGDWLERRSG
ncbi:MAG: HEPN domain-containing protein [Acidimicrobiia bacterium]